MDRNITSIARIETTTTNHQHQQQPSIKFDFKFSNKKNNFIDTVVYKTSTGKLETKLYQKDTGRKVYLHRKSEHPRS